MKNLLVAQSGGPSAAINATLCGVVEKGLADKIGVSASIVSNYENGERTPSLEILIALARIFQCSTDYLLGFEKLEKDKVLDVSMLNDEQRILLQHFLFGLME